MDKPLLPQRNYRRELVVMSLAFGANHATVTTPLIYAASVLTNRAGQFSDATLYGLCLVSSLFVSQVVNGLIGCKRGIELSMLSYAIYVFLFAVSASECVEYAADNTCIEGAPLQMPLALLGATVGGLGAGVLWTCQGVFFSSICELVAESENLKKSTVTAELAGVFSFIFLAWECTVRLVSTLLAQYVRLSFGTVFFAYSGVAFLASITFMVFGKEVGKESVVQRSVWHNTLDTVKLWRDPNLWLLQCTNVAFGFAVSWEAGYVARYIISPALGSAFIGFAGAVLSGVAATSSVCLSGLAARAGKGIVIGIGSLSFLLLAVLSKVGHPATWGWGTLVFYFLMGVGRAVYESTNKAIFADFFPGDKSVGAFANVFVFGTGASTVAFIMGAESVNGGELYLLIGFAALTLPCYMLACVLRRRGQASQGLLLNASDQ